MLNSILIGLDGSPESNAALEWVLPLAKARDALLVGLGIVDVPGIREGESMPLGMSHLKEARDERMIHRARVQTEQILEQFSLKCSEAQVSSKVLEEFDRPEVELAEESQRYDVVVLGRETYFEDTFNETPDTFLRDVLRVACRPIIRVSAKPAATTPEALHGQSVMIAYDGSAQAARTLQIYQLLGIGRDIPTHVVGIDSDKKNAVTSVERAVDFLHNHAIHATPHIIATSTHAGKVLLEQQAKLNAGLVVMGAHGDSALKEFFFGSVTRTLLDKCPVPLFLYH